MSVAKVVEITSESAESFEDAARKGVERAAGTLEGIAEAWIKGQKIVVEGQKPVRFRVDMKVTFVLKE